MNAMPDFESYDALGLAKLVKDRQVTAGELLQTAIERVEARNPKINAVVSKLYDEAKAQIAAGLPDGAFAGVPFLLKDLGLQLAGTVTSGGSNFFADARADHDSELVARYKRAGLVIFGKTNTSEFGLSTSTEPRLHGPTRNPWNLEHSAGGSSGGAAAAVAAGMLPLANASDGGGSIRVPASCCGLFGLKPTRARVPMGPDVGEGWSGSSVVHAVSRSVRDSAALLDATAGPDIGDPYFAPPQERPYLAEVGQSPGRLKIAMTTKAWNGQPVDEDCARAVHQAAQLCERLGHHIEEASPAIPATELAAANRVIISANVRASLEARGKALGREPKAGDVEGITWTMSEYGRTARASDYAAAIQVLHRTGRIVGRFLTQYDMLLTPTQCRPPHRLGVLDMMTGDTKAFTEAIFGTIAFTAPFNATGNPAMSVPLGWSQAGLPIGIQFVGPFGDEATLFRLAAQLEAIEPWAHRRPPLAAQPVA